MLCPAPSPPASSTRTGAILAVAGDAGLPDECAGDGDGGVRIGSNIVVMVWEDKEYGLIAWKQETHFGRHTDLSFGNPEWNYAGPVLWLARPLRTKFAADLTTTLEAAFEEKGPSLVVDPD